jgi:hypothetical protein
LSEEELDDYEATLELALVQEYKAVLGMFSYAIETDRRFYLANDVSVEVESASTPTLLEVTLTDACGLGHVPCRALRAVGTRSHVSRRERRAFTRQRTPALERC